MECIISEGVESIDPLAEMTRLITLKLENLKRISDLSPLAGLTGLEGLTLGGDLWTIQKVRTLEPLAGLVSLESLCLVNLVSLDGSPEPLAALKQLEVLRFHQNEYAIEKLAWLSTQLPNTDHYIMPYAILKSESIRMACKRCSDESLVLTFGKGGRQISLRANDHAKRGSLVIVGGGGIPDGLRDRFMALAGGKAARLVIIPTASSAADKKEEEEGYLEPWKKFRPASLSLLHTRSRETYNATGLPTRSTKRGATD